VNCVTETLAVLRRSACNIDPLSRGIGDAKMTTALLDRLTHHCDIVEAGNDSWQFKIRDGDQTARARPVSAIPASSGKASAIVKPHRSKVSNLNADTGSNLQAG
jgi:hypothetical protein